MRNAVYSVGVIGCGRIVSGFDAPGDSRVFTHLHALTTNPRFRVAGVFDTDDSATAAASVKWSVPGVGGFSKLAELAPDIFLIAVPDEGHKHYLDAVLDARPSLVLCEKPITPSLDESRSAVKRYADLGVKLAVGYQRRFDADVNAIRDKYRSGALGRFLGGTVWFSKGLLHNGSHAVDLLRFVLGEVTSARALGSRFDFTPQDPSVAAVVAFAAGDVFFAIGDERCFSIFEIDLLFEQARYRLTDSGMQFEVAAVRADLHFAGYKTLVVEENRASTLVHALARMWESTALALDSGAPMVNTAAEALRTQEICADLIQQARSTGASRS